MMTVAIDILHGVLFHKSLVYCRVPATNVTCFYFLYDLSECLIVSLQKSIAPRPMCICWSLFLYWSCLPYLCPNIVINFQLSSTFIVFSHFYLLTSVWAVLGSEKCALTYITFWSVTIPVQQVYVRQWSPLLVILRHDLPLCCLCSIIYIVSWLIATVEVDVFPSKTLFNANFIDV